MRREGKITNWKDERGFGFIAPNGGGEHVFVHIKAFSNRQRRPVGNEIVTYVLSTDQKGRARAENVVFAGDRLARPTWLGVDSLSIVVAPFFLLFLYVLVVTGRAPMVILIFYLGASAATVLAYTIDKAAAENDRWRIRESTLHMLSLIGGWPGALVAQTVLRHKSRKRSFQVAYSITVVMNCSILGWILSPAGASTLRYLWH